MTVTIQLASERLSTTSALYQFFTRMNRNDNFPQNSCGQNVEYSFLQAKLIFLAKQLNNLVEEEPIDTLQLFSVIAQLQILFVETQRLMQQEIDQHQTTMEQMSRITLLLFSAKTQRATRCRRWKHGMVIVSGILASVAVAGSLMHFFR